ncbi:energy-coupling factor ABC transporter permease [Polaromonas jejuensis]|uniref:Energy-coupling factor ABC transporter permease n=1 Tax=Polaromonas jejuensis TaxID=457502 RepID=A0ABW0Q7N2_9BURK|nr:energy-coupling factor ABC transporter permease [Polaromonas jejuensis]
MHIEPGLLAQSKLVFAAGAAAMVFVPYVPTLLKSPKLWLRTVLAAVFFSLFMESFHLQAGPSELHFVGAMPIYLAFGFVPTLFAFGLGLLLQGLLFEPQDLVHLAVNTLSLAVPLLAVHYTLGRKLKEVTLATVLKLDGAYYAGVVAMVGFWLTQAEVAFTFADWALFASSYIPLVIVEPVFTLAILWLLQRFGQTRLGAVCFAERPAAATAQ